MKTVQHFLYLDLIRGIAALSVLIYHLEESIQDRHFFSGSFLAVDLFFLMSGFVLTRAYEARLRSGAMSFKRFVGVRLLRLYPLYFTAIAIGIGYYVFKIAFVPVEPGLMSDLAKAVPAALLVLPSPAATHAFQGAYPFAASAWSLSLELWFNLIYGVLIFRLSTRSIGVIAALAGCLTIFFALREGSFDMGWGWSTMYGGIARFWFSFSLGILIYRRAKMPPYASVLAAILAPIGLAYVTIGHANLWLQGIYIFGIFPLVVMTYAWQQPPAWAKPICDHAGRFSYGIYILHAPLFLVMAGAIKMVTHLDLIAFSFGNWIFIAAAICIASAFIIYGGDEPFRQYLSAKRRDKAA